MPPVLDSLDGAARPEPDLAALRRHDEEAWSALVQSFGPRLLSVSRRLLRDEGAAEDCVQSAFVQALAGIGRFEGRSSIATWLHRIAVNVALVRLRSQRRKPEQSIEPLLPVFDRTGYRQSVGAVSRSPEELAGRADAAQIIWSAIDLLPESYRTVLVLRNLDELSNTEVAEILGLTPTAVKVRLHRARSALKTLLEMPLAQPRISRVREMYRWVLGAPGRAIPLVITCRQFEDFVMDFFDGTLAPRPRKLFELHLRTCRECRQYLERYRATLALTDEVRQKETPTEVPRALVRAIAGAMDGKKGG